MNTPSDTVAEARLEAAAPAPMTPTSPLLWSVRRELWENRSIFTAPLAVAGLFLLGFLVNAARLPDKVRAAAALDPMKQRAAMAVPYDLAAGLMMLTAMVVAIFYCLDALYGERRDRSTLFWKSLPVSDLTTVIAKASVPLVVLPLLATAITAVMHLTMLAVSSVVLAASGESVAELWSRIAYVRTTLLMLYHMVVVHSVSHAPFYAWLLLVSAWASRAPLLWAVLPPLAVGFLEKLTFNTTYFLALVGNLLTGETAQMHVPGMFPTHPMTHLTPGVFLTRPSLWIGLVATAVFLGAAARLRRHRGPI